MREVEGALVVFTIGLAERLRCANIQHRPGQPVHPEIDAARERIRKYVVPEIRRPASLDELDDEPGLDHVQTCIDQFRHECAPCHRALLFSEEQDSVVAIDLDRTVALTDVAFIDGDRGVSC